MLLAKKSRERITTIRPDIEELEAVFGRNGDVKAFAAGCGFLTALVAFIVWLVWSVKLIDSLRNLL